ncbi:hypothetical protein RB195_004425 [Necator americanus]|uniref:Uncharacterized protein n=1 Tax=Necator americanus TaxID=51031 RepID=A0ABR1BK14_NECAM
MLGWPVFTGRACPNISSARFVPSPLSSKMFSNFKLADALHLKRLKKIGHTALAHDNVRPRVTELTRKKIPEVGSVEF